MSLILERTPRDKQLRGVDWQGKLFGLIDAKGYVSPDGMIFRFVYNGVGPYLSLTETGSLGDAAPAWARSK